ncbi:MAG: ArnT family glycosyltransferase [Anaerolineae bacterium]
MSASAAAYHVQGARRPKPLAPVLVLLLGAAALRLAGLDWDGGGLFHPDERRILMVVSQLHWPEVWDWPLVLGPQSPLNPQFFSYGSLPLYMLRLAQARTGWPDGNLYALGRFLSAGADILTTAVVLALGRRLAGRHAGYLAAGLYALAVLPLQLSHFATVDTLLVLFSTLALSCLVTVARRGSRRAGVLAGICTGLALATKLSALPLVVVAAIAWAGNALRGSEPPRIERHFLGLVTTLVAVPIAFLVAEPYALLDWYHFGAHVLQEMAMARGWLAVAYTRQYVGAVPYLYTLRQLVLWSLGPPLGLLGLAGVLWLSVRALTHRRPGDLVLISWFWLCFGLIGGSFAQFARYTAPLIPLLCLAAGMLLRDVSRSGRSWRVPLRRERVVLPGAGHCHGRDHPSALPSRRQRVRSGAAAMLGTVVLMASLAYAVAFAGIYLRTHPWMAASQWLCGEAPKGAAVVAEVWDDTLPVRAVQECIGSYRQVWIDPYAPEDARKLEALLEALQQADYVVLPSQRAYASVGLQPARYPLMAAYYRQLFAGALGYELAYVATNYPRLGPLALVDEPLAGSGLRLAGLPRPAAWVLSWGRADESYSVYDHPRVLIFRKHRSLSAEDLRALFATQSGG